MDAMECRCGAAGMPFEAGAARRAGESPQTIWRGDRIGRGRAALEPARTGETTCPACHHRASVFLIVDEAAASGAR